MNRATDMGPEPLEEENNEDQQDSENTNYEKQHHSEQEKDKEDFGKRVEQDLKGGINDVKDHDIFNEPEQNIEPCTNRLITEEAHQ